MYSRHLVHDVVHDVHDLLGHPSCLRTDVEEIEDLLKSGEHVGTTDLRRFCEGRREEGEGEGKGEREKECVNKGGGGGRKGGTERAGDETKKKTELNDTAGKSLSVNFKIAAYSCISTSHWKSKD